ncbi:efflux RND transporter periplasmic adaptor subunit [Tichowtungia aerotolerans]|uniref:HlyD family efflux transporter periplasmic adaptor subunit n=1 Tax=Tichowtungia aerotolerans TaxID=2697043 RepID=A0A6P1M2X6_9BACT|nr:efflux RND transporter periplasmic adaptor subunit [Tichowtungia aerotolerans]QHI68960.1 HlyD family efflux transporter periplasmic adaptor subunit [Tichowtungia aerotolerans]
MKKTIFWFIVLLILAGGGYYRHKSLTQQAVSGPAYDTATVERRDLRTTVESTGEVEPRNRLKVISPIAGRLEKLLVDEGDSVEKGQILGWVSSTERATLLDAALAKSQKELEYWQELYNPTPLISPLGGTIIARDFEPGQTISSSDSIVVIADDLIVVANLDETDIGQIQVGQTVEVTLEAYPEKTFPCVVEKIAYNAKTISNVTMYEVDVRPVNLPSFARSGMTANLEVIIEERKNALTLPASAIQQKAVQSSAPAASGESGGGNLREHLQSMNPDERKAAIVKRMRERGLSDTEIQERLQRFAGGGPGEGSGAMRPGGTKAPTHRAPAVAEQSYVLTGSMVSPTETAVETGVSDGTYIEITKGLKEGDRVLIPKISLGSGKTNGGSLFMPRPRSGGSRR